jgi:hypothetical protein
MGAPQRNNLRFRTEKTITPSPKSTGVPGSGTARNSLIVGQDLCGCQGCKDRPVDLNSRAKPSAAARALGNRQTSLGGEEARTNPKQKTAR